MTSSARFGRVVPYGLMLFGIFLGSCGGGGGGGTSTGPDPGPPNECAAGQSFTSTFEGVQKRVFEAHGCTQDVCHGSAAQGGLALSSGVAYENLIEVPSLEKPGLARVYPGDNDRSYLWLKLAAATNPGSVEIAGAPMPNGLPALSSDELELVRLWIHAGAPETGTVIGTEALLGACLPAPRPLTIKPLDAPAAGEGVQLVMPEWHLPAHSEHEICFASYFDISDQVPAEYQDPSGQYFRFSSQEQRQDPQSHHLILNYSVVPVSQIHDPAFGDWTCKGGDRDGAACEPTEPGACGTEGLCGSAAREGFACTGFGPGGGFGVSSFQIGGSQQAQSSIDFYDGVFAQIPMRGLLYWNSHAFNLTDTDHTMHARLNYTFAKKQLRPVRTIFDASRIFAANAAPFTTQTVCHEHALPQGARLFSLSSHTHRHGKHFTVDLAEGTRIYESFVYNDPVDQHYDPPLAFDSPDPKQRRLRYCSLYNNGVKEDGSPDTELVTRASRVPASAQATIGRCKPIACTAGSIGAACNGSGDAAACDSAPGAGDGECDACRITGGESTENEMFILIGQYFLASESEIGQGDRTDAGGLAAPAAGDGGRSPFVGLAVPSAHGCTSSHAGHGAAEDGGAADEPGAGAAGKPAPGPASEAGGSGGALQHGGHAHGAG